MTTASSDAKGNALRSADPLQDDHSRCALAQGLAEFSVAMYFGPDDNPDVIDGTNGGDVTIVDNPTFKNYVAIFGLAPPTGFEPALPP